MSRTDQTVEEARALNTTDRRDALNVARRFKLGGTASVKWQVIGVRLLSGKPEVREAEVFSGVGFYSRPRAGSNAEAFVVFAGGAENPVIVATRDEDVRKAMAKLLPDEAAVYNSSTIILVKKDGTVEIRSGGGAALKLPTMADFGGIISIMNAAGTGAATALPAAVLAYQTAHPTWPAGTTVLKAE